MTLSVNAYAGVLYSVFAWLVIAGRVYIFVDGCDSKLL